jgi:hypothetical protein
MKGVCYAYLYVFWSEVYVGCSIVVTPRPNVQNYLPDVTLGAPLCCFKISCFLKLNISYYGCSMWLQHLYSLNSWFLWLIVIIEAGLF